MIFFHQKFRKKVSKNFPKNKEKNKKKVFGQKTGLWNRVSELNADAQVCLFVLLD